MEGVEKTDLSLPALVSALANDIRMLAAHFINISRCSSSRLVAARKVIVGASNDSIVLE